MPIEHHWQCQKKAADVLAAILAQHVLSGSEALKLAGALSGGFGSAVM